MHNVRLLNHEIRNKKTKMKMKRKRKKKKKKKTEKSLHLKHLRRAAGILRLKVAFIHDRVCEPTRMLTSAHGSQKH